MNTLKSHNTEPAFFRDSKSDLSLSGTALVELLKSVLDEGKPFRFQARGVSMAPFVKDGDVVTISPLAGGAVCVGEVVALIHPEAGRLVIHRVVGRSGNSYLIKGDNSFEGAGLFPKTSILGRVTRVERDGKRVFLGFALGRFLTPCLPLLLSMHRLADLMLRRWQRD